MEFAIVAIPLFLFIFTCVEFGRVMMTLQTLDEAARVGCRAAVLGGASADTAKAAAREVLDVAGLPGTITVEPDPLETAELWSPISVNIQLSVSDATWLPVPRFLTDQTLSASSTLPKEVDETATSTPEEVEGA